MKLISMTDYVIQEMNKLEKSIESTCHSIDLYSKFLIKPLNIGMFVPCDLEGNILEEPKPENYFDINKTSDKFNEDDKNGLNYYSSALNYYDNAKEKVLFSGCEIEKRWNNIHVLKHGNTVFFSNWPKTSIEQIVKHRIDLTESAIKQLSL